MTSLDWQSACGLTPKALLRALGIGAPPVCPFAIAEILGIEVRHTEDPEAAGEYGCDQEGNPHIFVNKNDPATRQRFVCAHGIGHIILGHSQEKLGLLELLANRFAAALLMPGSWVREYRLAAPRHNLATIFGVSSEIMFLRQNLEVYGLED